MNASPDIKELAAALSKAQGTMEAAKKDSTNPHFQSKYADLAAVVAAIKHPFAENGLSYVQLPLRTDKEEVAVETLLMHASGQWIISEWAIPVSKADAQAHMAALTYCRRGALAAMAGIAPDDDDDGNTATAAMARPERAPEPTSAPTRAARPTCPVCGKQTLFQNRAQRTWFCSAREGGCQTGWPASETPPTAPPHGDVLDLPPGTTTPQQAEAEGNALFPTEAPESAAELLEAIRERFKLVKNAIVQERLWKAHCGAAPFLSANVDVAALSNLLAALGGSVAR